MSSHGRRLLCLDLDGTLLNDHWFKHHTVSKANRDAVAAASRAGFVIALCSGRGPSMHIPTGNDLGVLGDIYLVGYNGGIVYRMDNMGKVQDTLFETKLSREHVNRVLDLSQGLSVVLDIGPKQVARPGAGKQQEDFLKWHSTTAELRSSPYVETNLDEVELPNKISVIATATGLEGFVNSFSVDGIGVVPTYKNDRLAVVETFMLGQDKANGVKLVCREIGIELNDCVYFGDGANDVSSLRACGFGVAMAQGSEEAKKAANKVSQWTCNEDAVGKELSLLLDGECIPPQKRSRLYFA